MRQITSLNNGKVIFEADLSTMKEVVELAVKQKISLAYTDLRGADLGGADLRNADFQGANFQKAKLEGADLTGADLREA